MNAFKGELYDEMYLMAKLLLERGVDGDGIEKHLSQKTEDIVLITVVIKEARKDHFMRLRKEGFVLIGIGSITGVLGVLITCLNFYSNRSVDLALYGLTTLGIIIAFWGLFKLIG